MGTQRADGAGPLIRTDYLRAATVRLDLTEPLAILQIGAGGNGGWLAPHLARLVRILNDQEVEVRWVVIDPDTVEEKNLVRQNFCFAEVGQHKAEALALRYSAAWGIEVEYWNREFSSEVAREMELWDTRNLIVAGCVDNAKARQDIVRAFYQELVQGDKTLVWWLDMGNAKDAGQVLLGNFPWWDSEIEMKAFPGAQSCVYLPAPHLQEPTLLVPLPEEKKRNRLSCAEMAARNAQSLAINQRVASEAATMLSRLLITDDLRYFASYFDTMTGSWNIRYCTPEAVREAIQT